MLVVTLPTMRKTHPSNWKTLPPMRKKIIQIRVPSIIIPPRGKSRNQLEYQEQKA